MLDCKTRMPSGWTGLLLLIVSAQFCLAQNEALRPGLDSPGLRILVADFTAVGGNANSAKQLSIQLRRSLAGITGVEVISGENQITAANEAEAALLNFTPQAAFNLGNRTGADAIVYGRLVTDISASLNEKPATQQPWVQLYVVETLSREGHVTPGKALIILNSSQLPALLTREVLVLAPPLGKVLNVTQNTTSQTIQIFPLAGRVLQSGAEYGVFRPAASQILPDSLANAQVRQYARQGQRLGVLTGHLRTEATATGHMLNASPVIPGPELAPGQFVGPAQASDSIAPTRLIVISEPAGAVVMQDQKCVGITPVTLESQPGQPLAFEIHKRDYYSEKFEIPVLNSGITVAGYSLKKLPDTGELVIRSVPSGAMVTIDGKKAGLTPLTLEEHKPGDVKITLELEGYLPASGQAKITRGQRVETDFTLLEELRPLSIKSEPAGALVYIDGVEQGVTPLELPGVRTGRHLVRFQLEGYAVEEPEILVAASESSYQMRFKLRPLMGNLQIQTSPPGANVELDGQYRGKSPLAITGLQVGLHKIQVILEGFKPEIRDIEVQDQQTTNLEITLINN